MVRQCVSRFSGLQEPSKGKRTEPGTKFISRSVERKAFLFYSLLFTSALVMECFLRTKRSYNKRKKQLAVLHSLNFFSKSNKRYAKTKESGAEDSISTIQTNRFVQKIFTVPTNTPLSSIFLVRYVLVNILS